MSHRMPNDDPHLPETSEAHPGGGERAVAFAEAAAADAEAAHHVVESLEGGDGFAAVGQGVAGAAGALGHALHGLGVHDAGVDTALAVVKGIAEAYAAVEETVRELDHMVQHGREHRAHERAEHEAHTQAQLRAEERARFAEQHRVRFDLLCEHRGEGEWQVRDVTLTESLGRPYRAEITVVNEDLDVDAGYLIGLDATLVIERGAQRREVHGIVSRVEHGERSDTAISAKLVLVPALEALRHGVRSQVYQDCTVYHVLDMVLSRRFATFQREHEVRFTREQLPREICVQFQESDLDFVHRLLEEEGMTYYFEQPLGADQREKLILIDEAERVPLREGDDEVPFVLHRGGDFEHREPIYELVGSDRLVVGHVVAVDFDWTRRGSMGVAAKEGDGGHPDPFTIESYEHDGRVVHADYASHAYQRNDIAVQAVMRREAHRVDRWTYRGVGAVTWFSPGAVFDLVGHPAPGFDQSYRVTEVTHRGRDRRFGHRSEELGPDATQSEYECSFTCLTEEHPFRPERTTRRPRIHGIQTAVVVGRAPEDIWTDARGRVRIQFHWDREGASDQTSTCWVRCVQQWAGEGHGAIFVPRVGSEVAVTFLDGDPDRPVVVGCLYNGTNPPWLDLEQDKTRSGWRTGSSIAGAGYNELSFEDREGHEEVHLRAQRNLRELVLHDHTTRVRQDQTNRVDRDQKESVGQDQFLVVERNRQKVVEKVEVNTIGVDRLTEVARMDAVTVGKNHDGTRRIHVYGEELHVVDDNRTVEVKGVEGESFGRRRCVVETQDQLEVKGNRTVKVHESAEHEVVRGHWKAFRAGTQMVLDDQQVFVEAADHVRIQVGRSALHIQDDRVYLKCGDTVVDLLPDRAMVHGAGEAVLRTSQSTFVKAQSTGVAIKGPNVYAEAEQIATILGGTLVRIN